MNHINLGARLYMARGSVNSFHLLRYRGWIPANHQTSGHVLKEEKRPGPNLTSTIPTAQTSKQCPMFLQLV